LIVSDGKGGCGVVGIDFQEGRGGKWRLRIVERRCDMYIYATVWSGLKKDEERYEEHYEERFEEALEDAGDSVAVAGKFTKRKRKTRSAVREFVKTLC